MIGDITEATGAPRTIEIGGKVYTASPLTLLHIGEIMARVKAERYSPLRKALQEMTHCPPEIRDGLIDKALDEEKKMALDTPSGEEMGQWFMTPAGAAFALHLTLRKHHPEATVEFCAGLLDGLDDRVLSFLLDQATGLGSLGN